MSAALRRLVFLAGGLLGMPLALGGLTGLPAFGTGSGALGDLIVRVGLPERHATNLVSAVMFDYRGLDTLVEEFVFMAAVLGLMLLLRQLGSEAEGAPPDLPHGRPLVPRTEAIVLAGRWGAPVLALLGLQTALHAHLTPGGGFQGGALAGSAALLIYLGEGYGVWRRICRTAPLEFCEGLAGGGFVLCGLAPLLAGGSFLENRLPLGHAGQLLSAGTIPLLNLVAGVAVAAGFALAIGGFLQQTRARAPEPES